MSEKIRVNLLSLIGLLIIYCAAFGLDRLAEYTKRLLSFSANPIPGLWAWSGSNILLTLLVFLFYRWAMPKLHPLIIWGIVIVGLLIDFLPVLYFSPLTTINLFSISLPYLMRGTRGYFILVGALTAIAGIFTLSPSVRGRPS
jgi:hypothetical protein